MSFITDTGKTIKVDKVKSLKMEKTQERGRVCGYSMFMDGSSFYFRLT